MRATAVAACYAVFRLNREQRRPEECETGTPQIPEEKIRKLRSGCPRIGPYSRLCNGVRAISQPATVARSAKLARNSRPRRINPPNQRVASTADTGIAIAKGRLDQPLGA